LTTGIILLDILILNADRKRTDLWFDPETKLIYAFDCSHALLGYRQPPGFDGVRESWLSSKRMIPAALGTV